MWTAGWHLAYSSSHHSWDRAVGLHPNLAPFSPGDCSAPLHTEDNVFSAAAFLGLPCPALAFVRRDSEKPQVSLISSNLTCHPYVWGGMGWGAHGLAPWKYSSLLFT